MYRMTYNNCGVTGCSARGIAIRDTYEELLILAENLKDSICNVEIKSIDQKNTKNSSLKFDVNMKEMK
jgi:hypothetical protein